MGFYYDTPCGFHIFVKNSVIFYGIKYVLSFSSKGCVPMRNQDTLGIGTPLALQVSVTLSPSRTVISALDVSS